MAIYWALLGSISAFSAVGVRRAGNIKAALIVLFVFFVGVVGLRDRVGRDWSNYLELYTALSGASLTALDFAREPAFFLINWIAYETGLGINFVNLVHASIFLGGLFYFAYKKCPDKFLAIAVATPYLIVVVGMSGIRQAAAIGVFMFLLGRWDSAGYVQKIFLIVLASTFHASAILLVSLIVIDSRQQPIRLFVVGLGALAVGLTVFGPNQDYYVSSYVQENLESAGAVYHALLVVGPGALYVLMNKRFARAGLLDPTLFRMAIVSLVLFPFLPVSLTGIDRFLLYFTPVQMFALSAAPLVLQARLVHVLLLLMNAFILWGWLEFANNADAWRDYSSCLAASVGCFH
ncbi:EpsG family protein [Ramlibacter sp. AN1133]|uniref:EpsG family protein n=1 Tax=Ramlibacter sp. AN1133 TaxID=3133429 RepID=UPI0030BE900E